MRKEWISSHSAKLCPKEEGLFDMMLDVDGVSNSQANMIREEILDSIDDMGVEIIEN